MLKMPKAKDCKKAIILEDMDFTWREDEMEKAVKLWEAGVPFQDMVAELRPERRSVDSPHRYVDYSTRADEVALLLFHLSRQGRINCRPGGVLL